MINKEEYINLPEKPGVYLFYDKDKNLLYIGKAKNLKKRVSSYFSGVNKFYRTELLRRRVKYIDFLITGSEAESLIVEQNLIQENKPLFNIQLKDSKSFPVIVITEDIYPAIYMSKQNNKDKGIIFGPFTSVKATKHIYNFILKNYKIRNCRKNLKKKSKACLNYQINLCTAPCERLIERDEYNKNVKKAINFLKGNYSILLKDIKKEIENAIEKMDFEKANELKYQYLDVLKFKEKFGYKITTSVLTDFFGFYLRRGAGLVTLVRMKGNKKLFTLTKNFKYYEQPEYIIPTIILGFYNELKQIINFEIPEVIFIPSKLIINEIGIVIRNYFNRNEIKIKSYSTKSEHRFLKQLIEHLREYFKEEFILPEEKDLKVVKNLAKLLDIETGIERIEGFDISNLGDEFIVGASVSFLNGVKDRKNYRHYSIRSIDYQNDVAAITEIVGRRLMHYINNGEKLPELLLIDGGKPQVNAVYKLVKKLNLNVNVIGLAKKEEIIVLPEGKGEIKLSFNSEELRLLIKIRDEAHRFANRYRKIKIKKDRLN